ncbi:MAG: hypothetical protein D6784_08595 [Chloroflexi bacterium]|nr:MAG: hypothetical protein D6784_08595 [Chloroflexota bacterium]
MRQWFKSFPDPRSVDVIQQLGVDFVILHSKAYSPEQWTQIMQDLPRYWFAVENIYTVGEALVLKLVPPSCKPSSAAVNVRFQPAILDGLPNSLDVVFENTGPAAFVSDVRQVSRLNFANGAVKNFTEPLVVPPGARQYVTVPLTGESSAVNLLTADLASLQRTVSVPDPPPVSNISVDDWPRQSLGLAFVDGPQLAAYRLSAAEATPCTMVGLALEWVGGHPADRVLVQLTDPFGRVVFESITRPWASAAQSSLDVHWLPVPGTTPPGQYGLRVWVQTAAGESRWPMTDEGVPLPPNQLPPVPLLIHPPQGAVPAVPAVLFENGVQLRAEEPVDVVLQPGGWLRFDLTWQVMQPVDTMVTVFTQLLGPDGRVWGQYDNQPGGGWYPFALWPAHRPVTESYAIQLSPDAPPGEYRLIAGLYEADTGVRILLSTGGDFVDVGTIRVEQ